MPTATRPNRPAARRSSPKKGAPSSSRSTWLWVGIVTVVLCAALVAVFASRDTKKASTPGVEQTRAVTITGDALPALPSSGTDPAVGKQIPEVQGSSFDGTPVSITRDGKAKVLVFVAHWCPHCRNEVPRIVDHLRSTPAPAGVELYAVSTSVSDSRPNYPPSAWLADEGWPIATVADASDSTTAVAYGLSAFPYFVAVGPAGNVVARTTGEITMTEFDQLVARALAG